MALTRIEGPSIVNSQGGMDVLLNLRAIRSLHRLQLSRNLWDSPGFVDFVPGPGGPSYLSRKVTD